jgi:hypothetical protein
MIDDGTRELPVRKDETVTLMTNARARREDPTDDCPTLPRKPYHVVLGLSLI